MNVAPGVEVPPGGRYRQHNPLVLHYQAEDLDPDAREELLETLAQLIVEQPHVPRWLFKARRARPCAQRDVRRGSARFVLTMNLSQRAFAVNDLETGLRTCGQVDSPDCLARLRRLLWITQGSLLACARTVWPCLCLLMPRGGGDATITELARKSTCWCGCASTRLPS